ncbi:MAG: hypothetical protein K2H01_00150, partial [Ruminococcus sp.]|nr:hypothetical protein [Ruminococcus sp.]
MSAMELFLGKHLTAIIIIIAGLIGATAFIVCWVSSKYDSMKNKFYNLPCSHHNEKIDSHDNQLTDTRVLLSRMEAQLEILVTNSIEKSNKKIRSKSGSAFSAKHSPRRHNENGIYLLKEV